jgi:hypothetical protein
MVTGVPHHSALVQGLVNDHRQLLQAFGRLKHCAEAEDPGAFKHALVDFKALLVPHLLQEAIKLYTFLRQELKAQGNQQAYQMVNGYKTETRPVKDMLFNISIWPTSTRSRRSPALRTPGLDTAAAVLEECAKFNEGVIAR